MSSGKTAAEIGIPREAIYEAMKTFSTAKLRVSRRNDKGQIAQLYSNVPIPIELLLEIDSWLEPLCGGGSFKIEAENPNGNTPPLVVPPFIVTLESPPRPRVPLAPPQYDEQGKVMIPRQGAPAMMGSSVPWGSPPPMPAPQFGPTVPQYADVPASGWAQGLNPDAANAYIQAGNQMYAPQGSPFPRPMMAPPKENATVNNPVYDNFVAQMRGQLSKAEAEAVAAREKYADLQQRTREEHEKLIREHERKVDEMRRQAEQDRRTLEDAHRRELATLEKSHLADEKGWERERQELRDRALRAEMQATSAANTPKGNGMTELITPLAPALIAMINQSGERERAAQANQIEMLKLQMASKGEDPTLAFVTKLMPVMMPLIQQWMQNKSPDAIAALLEASQNSQMQSIGMTMQMIEAMTPEEKPVWAQALMEFLGSMRGVGEKLFEKWEQPPQQPPRQLPPGPQMQAQQVQQAQAAGQRPPLRVVRDPVVEEIESMLMPMIPKSFQTAEWRDIIVALKKKLPQEVVAKMLVEHLANLIKNDMVPKELGPFVDQPVDAMDSLIRPLAPILGLSEEYIVPIMWGTLTELGEMDLIDFAPPEDGGEGDEEAEGNGASTLSEAGIHKDLDYEPSEA